MNKSAKTCTRYNSYIINNQTFIQISTAYEGIPQNLAINVVAYAVLIILFIILRKKAWNYGKLAGVNKPISLVAASMTRQSRQEEGDVTYITEEKVLPNKKYSPLIETILEYIPSFIKMNDEELRKKCGSDAVIYCQFQRYLILIVAVMMCLSLVIIVPINSVGGLYEDSSNFAKLTIGNIKSGTKYLWAHFLVALVLMLFAFFLSNRFLQSVDDESDTEISSTIMIKRVPLEKCDELSIRAHFQEAYPSINVRRVQITHKVDKLIDIYTDKVSAEEALDFCYYELERNGKRIMVVPHPCGRLFNCRCCGAKMCIPVDGVEYYTSEVIRLNADFVKEKLHTVMSHTLPIVFVTLDSIEQALVVRKDYINQNYLCLGKVCGRLSSLSDVLETSKWKVTFAPEAEDILWQNLHKRGIRWWVPVVLANLVVAIVVMILSTPAMVLNLINLIKLPDNSILKSPIIAQVAPSLVLVLVNSLMPTLVYWSDQLSGHWTMTNQNMAVMNKLYAVLVTTVLVLPSLGLNSVPAMIRWLFPAQSSSLPDAFRWECIFMADGGALFCNYMISASFIGTALDLLRIGDLFILIFRMCYSRSRAEDQSIIQKILWEFPFGLGYAWTLALFSMVSAYAVIVPIITPFGLVYLLLKHVVDRYNMIHVNVPSVVHNSVHTNAAQLMQIGLVLTQATVTIYVTLRQEPTGALPICCYLAFALGILLTFGRTTKRWVTRMAFMKYSIINSPKDFNDKVHLATNDDSEGFVLVDEFKKSRFIPRQLTIEEPTLVEDLLRRKSLVAGPSSPSPDSHLGQASPDYGTNGH